MRLSFDDVDFKAQLITFQYFYPLLLRVPVRMLFLFHSLSAVIYLQTIWLFVLLHIFYHFPNILLIRPSLLNSSKLSSCHSRCFMEPCSIHPVFDKLNCINSLRNKTNNLKLLPMLSLEHSVN